MSKKTREYLIVYRQAVVGPEGWIVRGGIREFRCTARYKAEALMCLINIDTVFEVSRIERVKR